jgi:glycosyltransferase involved in cell wall biosynthesis
MRVALLEMHAEDPMATGQRGRAIAGFLRRRGHEVEVLAPDPWRLRDFSRFRFSLLSRLRRRVSGRRSLPHLWEYVADEMEARVRAGAYDAVIARAHPVSYVLTRGLACRKVVDVANVGYLELYYSGGADPAEVEETHRRELDVYRAADAVLLPNAGLASFFRRYVLDSAKVISVRLGCDPAAARAEFSPTPRIVYAGSYYYFQDPLLMARLVARSPYPIHFYGKADPNRTFLPSRLDYRGYEPTLDFLAGYQIGLVTVSQDWLRRHSPATKVPSYFAHGLPVLFPRWMEEGYEYPAAVAYDEDDFARQAVQIASDPAIWSDLGRQALETAAGLRWDDVLQPLLGVLKG